MYDQHRWQCPCGHQGKWFLDYGTTGNFLHYYRVFHPIAPSYRTRNYLFYISSTRMPRIWWIIDIGFMLSRLDYQMSHSGCLFRNVPGKMATPMLMYCIIALQWNWPNSGKEEQLKDMNTPLSRWESLSTSFKVLHIGFVFSHLWFFQQWVECTWMHHIVQTFGQPSSWATQDN